MQSRGSQASDGDDGKQHQLTQQRRCHESNRSYDQGLDPVVRFYLQLSTIHSLAAQRPTEFSNAFFQNILQRRTVADHPIPMDSNLKIRRRSVQRLNLVEFRVC